ncbi:MAG TPA: hypothetical protein VF342_17300 [Alphaproteobacteria bacterium]
MLGLMLAAGLLGACGPDIEPPPAEGRPFPNLATVPLRPEVAPPLERQAELAALTADRDSARRADEALRSAPIPPDPPPRRAARRSSQERTSAPPPSAAASPDGGTAAQQQAVVAPRPDVPSSAFMGSVVVQGDLGDLAPFSRKVLEDAARMAIQTSGRVRLVGGPGAEKRAELARVLIDLGVPANRIVQREAESRPTDRAVEIFVDY